MKVGTSHRLRFSPDGHYVVSIGRNVVLWDLSTHKRVAYCHPFQHPSHVDFSTDGKLLAVKNSSGTIVVLDVPSLKTLSVIKDKSWKEGCQLIFSPCNRFLLDGSWTGKVRVRDWQRAHAEFEVSHSNSMVKSISSSENRDFFAYVANPIATDKDAQLGNSNIICRKWPFTSNSSLGLPVQVRWVWEIALNPSGKYLLMLQQLGSTSFQLDLYEVSTGTALAHRSIRFGGANFSVAWSPEEHLVACVENDRVSILRAPSLELVDEIACQYCCHVEFSPDGQKLAVGSWQRGEIREMPSKSSP